MAASNFQVRKPLIEPIPLYIWLWNLVQPRRRNQTRFTPKALFIITNSLFMPDHADNGYNDLSVITKKPYLHIAMISASGAARNVYSFVQLQSALIFL